MVVAVLVVAACAGGPAPEPDPLGPEPPTSAKPEAVWTYLKEASYRDYWKPESTPKPGIHRSRPPHGPLIRNYVNEIADGSRPLGRQALPAGSVIVLENFTNEPTLHAIDVMVKIAGHRQATRDWAFLRFSPSGGIRITDREAYRKAKTGNRGCVYCHGRTPETDFLLQPRLPPLN